MKDKMLHFLILLCVVLTFGSLAVIIGYILIGGLGALRFEFFTAKAQVGILPEIVTTFYIVAITLLIAVPVGVFAAIYLTEYKKEGKIVNAIRFAVDSLAGIPSILFGLFGMLFFVSMLKFGWSLLSGALTLSIMILPTVIRTTEESLKAVPNSYREGSLALGATKLRTTLLVVLPPAFSGILTAVILSIGRIVGESAAVYLTAGMTSQIPKNIFQSGRTLSVHMFLIAKEAISFEPVFATGTVLIITVSIINFVANFIGNKLRRG